MAKKAETIMSMVTETDVTDRMSPHSSHIGNIYSNMQQQAGFFDLEITD